MININLFGGPGLGKSTTASGLFYEMKLNNYKVEFITEYAKELTYGNDYTKLADQLHILGEQHHRMFRLRDKVDYIIHDSPFVMGIVYLSDDPHLPKELYKELIVTMFKSYNNLNILLTRNLEKEYQEYGRSQSLDEAIEKDREIRQMLIDSNIHFVELKSHTDETISDIIEMINQLSDN